jgi:hypothetical protein
LTLDLPLKFKHYAGVQTYGTNSITMRAEVGLLTRNILIRGDELSKVEENGAHLIIHGKGSAGATGRIEYAEFTLVG